MLPTSGRLEVAVHQAGPIPLDADFHCEAGELLALVGPSGSGKTTLLRVIAGLMKPRTGRIACGEEVWFDDTAGFDRRPQQRRVGMVFQDYALFPHLTARDNVRVALGHLEASQRNERAERWLDRMHLQGLGNRYPSQLSGGQRQRVALARALAREPKALLLDEPFSAVDQVTRRRLQRELARLREQIRIPILLVTHDLDEAVALADRLCVLQGGSSLQMGDADTLFRHPASAEVARLLDRHNLFEGRMVESRGERRLQWGSLTLDVAQGLERLTPGEAVTWYVPDSDVVLHRAERSSCGPRENSVSGRISEMVIMGGTTSLAVVIDHVDETLRFDVSTHAARRGGLMRGGWVQLSLLASGIHLLPKESKERQDEYLR
ncbi:MAG: ABC transporter ATP-binding protein [Halomonas sp.]|nr:ABC transporter ATP-binding protein [Halomonas sp.]MCC5882562.1 ABC transporter ATP-binding protein [Halomonas sp.]